MEVINESIFPERQIEYAGFWQRFGAAFLDGLILLVPSLIFTYGLKMGPLSNILNVVINWLYFALQESGTNQATLGKKALGIRVVSLDGGTLSFGQATGRFFGKYVSILMIFIGYLWMLWDDRSQTIHDKMAGALVIRD